MKMLVRLVLLVLVLLFGHALAEPGYPPVLEGRTLVFPKDGGAHPDFRTEWWYVTGWMTDEKGVERGFQVTFFRVRTLIGEGNPSRFAPTQLVLAHAALADPGEGRLLHAERSARALDPLAGATVGNTRVWLDDWSLTYEDGAYHTHIATDDFTLALEMVAPGPPLLNGRDGFSQKAPDPLNASFYYSRPQLQVNGSLRMNGQELSVSGHAWMDHEWSSEILPEGATGWDWVGINLNDGGSLMGFQMRGLDGKPIWASGTLRSASGEITILEPDDITFTAGRRWESARSGVEYPVEWRISVGDRAFEVRPLMDDQELDSRRSTGAIYWEGAVRLLEQGVESGRGYLEMTGYAERLQM